MTTSPNPDNPDTEAVQYRRTTDAESLPTSTVRRACTRTVPPSVEPPDRWRVTI